MLWAAACLCFFGFLRSGEVVIPSDSGFDASVHLAFGDVVLDDLLNPSLLGLCPVVANIALHGSTRILQGPYFTFEDGKALTRDRFVRVIRVALAAEGIQSSFSLERQQ